MSKIKFYLKSEPNYQGALRVLEYYEYDYGAIYDASGKASPNYKSGRVDDEIRAQHPEEYKQFSDYVRQNEEKLYTECREAGEVEAEVEPTPEPVILEELPE